MDCKTRDGGKKQKKRKKKYFAFQKWSVGITAYCRKYILPDNDVCCKTRRSYSSRYLPTYPGVGEKGRVTLELISRHPVSSARLDLGWQTDTQALCAPLHPFYTRLNDRLRHIYGSFIVAPHRTTPGDCAVGQAQVCLGWAGLKKRDFWTGWVSSLLLLGPRLTSVFKAIRLPVAER